MTIDRGGQEGLGIADASGCEPIVAIARRVFGAAQVRVLLFASDARRGSGDTPRPSLAARAVAANRVVSESEPGHGCAAAAPLVARDGRRLGALFIAAPERQETLGAEEARLLARLAALAVDEIELAAAEKARRLAELRLNLAEAITDAALHAPDFRSAITACLARVAEQIGAQCAFARTLSRRTGRFEADATYLDPNAEDLAALHQRIVRTPIAPQHSILRGALFERRAIVIPDLDEADTTPFPLLAAVREAGLKSLLAVPYEDGGRLFSISFLFREKHDDLAGIAEALDALAPRVRGLLARKETEEQIAQLAARQAAVLDALPAHVALLDASGRILSVSRSWGAFAAEAGASPRGVGADYFEFLKRATAGAESAKLAAGVRAVLEGRADTFSGDYACGNERWRRWYRILLSRVAGGDGAVAMHLDVTSSKLAEDASRREKEFSEFLIKSTTEGILVFDRALRITLWNPGIEAITGIAAGAALGKNAFETLPFLVGTTGERAIRGALEGDEASFFDQRYAVAATGRHGFYEAYFSPLRSSASDIIGGIGFLRETTERRRMEDELRQSQKMEAVGQLTGGIAHDFNNMLTVIAGNLELLEGRLADEPRLLRLVSAATMAASRAEKLTQQLLTFSRRQQLRPEPIDFNQVILGMDEMLHRTVGETVAVRTQLATDLWPALADHNQFETALLNLVLNARDAMPDGGLVTLETANVEVPANSTEMTPGAYAMLAVGDSGIGMPESVLAHVFEPFFTTKAVGKGTGLGLAQVYGFISQSAGHVRIASRENEGTVVRLYLPRAEAAAAASGHALLRGRTRHGNETVLVAEDDDGVREYAAAVLRELGYGVIEAQNGDAALVALDAHPEIDLLFTDIVMPGRLNGADLARVARQRRSRLAVLFTSGYTTRLLENWPAEEVELLRKPYRSVDLAERVRAILDRADAAD